MRLDLKTKLNQFLQARESVLECKYELVKLTRCDHTVGKDHSKLSN